MTEHQITTATTWRGVVPTACDAPKSLSRQGMSITSGLDTPSPASSVTIKVSDRSNDVSARS